METGYSGVMSQADLCCERRCWCGCSLSSLIPGCEGGWGAVPGCVIVLAGAAVTVAGGWGSCGAGKGFIGWSMDAALGAPWSESIGAVLGGSLEMLRRLTAADGPASMVLLLSGSADAADAGVQVADETIVRACFDVRCDSGDNNTERAVYIVNYAWGEGAYLLM